MQGIIQIMDYALLAPLLAHFAFLVQSEEFVRLAQQDLLEILVRHVRTAIILTLERAGLAKL